MYKQFDVNNDGHNNNSPQHFTRAYVNDLNEFQYILNNNKNDGGGKLMKNSPTIDQLKKLAANHRYCSTNILQLKQQQMQDQYWQSNNQNDSRLINLKQFDKWQSSLEKVCNNNIDENKITKRHRLHHCNHPHHHHQHQHQHHHTRYYRQHEQSGGQRQNDDQQLPQQTHYFIYTGNNNNKNTNKSINYNKRQCNLTRSSLSPPGMYYNKDSDDDGNADSDIDNKFKLYGNNCEMNSYHRHQILPKQSDHIKLTDINCQNPAYEQHYQHYYSYFYRTANQETPKQKQQQRQPASPRNRRKLPISPISPISAWAMPYIKDSPRGNSPANENDFIERIERIGAAITDTTNSQNHHNRRNYHRNHNHNNYNHNVLREKTINNNCTNNNTNNDAATCVDVDINTIRSRIDSGICVDAYGRIVNGNGNGNGNGKVNVNANANSRNDNNDLHLVGRNLDDLKASGDFVENNDDYKQKSTILHNYLGNDVNKAERIRKLIQKNKHKMRTNLHLNGGVSSNPSSVPAQHIEANSLVNDNETINRRQQQQNNKELLHSNNNYNNNNNDEDKQQPNKLPTTPFKHKAIKELKKPSPPSPRNHRILIYNTQSPRISRLARPSRVRISRSSRSHLNQDITGTPQIYPSGKVLEGRVQILKSMSPIKVTEIKSKLKTGNVDKDHDFDNTDNDDDDNDDLDNVSNFDDSDMSDVSSESEEGYRSYAYKLTHPLNQCTSQQSMLTSSEQSLINPVNLLTPSLFPNVPPYLSFSSNTQKGPEVPADLYRVLKWRVSAVMPKIVRCILANSGMRLLKKTNDWMGVWGKHMKSPCFKSIRSYQKINHLPGSFRIGRKDSCWKNLVKLMGKYGKKDFGFMPRTYIIPNDLNQLRKSWPRYAQKNVKWIIKPPASARGAGIRVVDRWAQIPKRKPLIVQKYIERPLLINGSKFDLRLYVLVTSINPLRVYMYHNGLARFASVKYSDKSESLSDRCMHLTNYSINKLSSNYSKNEDVNACHGHKWTIKSLWNYLASRGVRIEYLWEALRNLVLRTILAGENSINNMIKANLESKYSCFELFGFDVLLDADLVPWLLEVNISPSLHSELPLDSHVKAPLVQSVLNTALYNVPPKISVERQREIAAEMCLPTSSICYDKRLYINYLSRMEKIKHNTFTRKTMDDRNEYVGAILEHLTPDDVRCLIITEDELARSKPLERIFPTADTYKYLKYTESPRYYNRLLDAWETRYSNKRDEGIKLLRQLCENKYHLQVPATPAKKDSSDEENNLPPQESSSNTLV